MALKSSDSVRLFLLRRVMQVLAQRMVSQLVMIKLPIQESAFETESLQINTDGLTHLYFALVKIDPKSCATVPGNDGDTERYADFKSCSFHLPGPGLPSVALISQTLDQHETHGISDHGADYDDYVYIPTTGAIWLGLKRLALRSSLPQGLHGKIMFQGFDLDWKYLATLSGRGKKDMIHRILSHILRR